MYRGVVSVCHAVVLLCHSFSVMLSRVYLSSGPKIIHSVTPQNQSFCQAEKSSILSRATVEERVTALRKARKC